jgi:catechol 2,3-dioxygenase-like lactoylglutathione lyase family enzyme
LAGAAASGSATFEPLRLDHLLLIVRGMTEAERFYCGVLGCTAVSRIPQHAMTELSTGLVLVDAADPNGSWASEGERGRNVDHFAIETSWFEEIAMREHLSKHGVSIEEERTEKDSLSFYVRDPSGNLVELIRKGRAPAR